MTVFVQVGLLEPILFVQLLEIALILSPLVGLAQQLVVVQIVLIVSMDQELNHAEMAVHELTVLLL
jgi:hypothetical protein